MFSNGNNIFILISITYSFLITSFFTPLTRLIGIKNKLYDIPNQRKQHYLPKVRIGGIAIFFGFILSIISFQVLNNFYLIDINFLQSFSFPLIFISLFFCLGLIDDIRSLPASFRLIIQIVLASFVWTSGIRIEELNVSWLNLDDISFTIPYLISYLITVTWIVGITNAVNWLDGLDGLAAGLSSISFLGFLAVSLYSSNYGVAIINSILLGSSLGFLKRNFFPSKIMMGDGGSYFLGSSLAILGILSATNIDGLLSLHIPLIILFLPIFDMTKVIISRIISGGSPFKPDRRHIHHNMLSFGLTEKRAVIIIYGISQWFTVLCLSLLTEKKVLLISISTSLLISLYYFINKSSKE